MPLGFIVLSAEEGSSCLDLVDQCHPDLVLLDVLMPGMSGWEAARALRRAGHDRTAILMLSANASENSEVLTPDRVHDGYLMKPIDIRQLLDKIRAVLKVEWTYDVPEQTIGTVPGARLSATDLPPPGQIDDLMRLGEIGYVRGIEAKLLEIEDNFPEHQVFVRELREIVSSFDLKRYMAVLGALRHDAH